MQNEENEEDRKGSEKGRVREENMLCWILQNFKGMNDAKKCDYTNLWICDNKSTANLYDFTDLFIWLVI